MKTVMTDGESAAVWDSQAARRCSDMQTYRTYIIWNMVKTE